jgi:outer membrane protein TolC
MNRIKSLVTGIALFGVSNLFAQEAGVTALSLKDCIERAVENNVNAVKARIDREKSGYKTDEVRSALLPQVNIAGSFQDNLKLPSTMIPGAIFGQEGMIAVQMGSQYNANAAITLNQALYSQTALTALKIAKQTDEMNRLGVEKTGEALAQEVAKLYFLAQITAKQLSLTKENIIRTERLAGIVKLLSDNGVGRQVDYDRVSVSLQNMFTQHDNTRAMQEQQLNMLKYLLALPQQQTIVLTDTADMPLLRSEPLPASDFSTTIDSRILASQKELARLNLKSVNHGYIPTLSFTGQFAIQGLRTEFENYFNDSPENKWYNSSYIGLSLSIPVFDGLNKRAKSRQAKLDYNKSDLSLHDAEERFSTDYKNAVNNYFNHKNNVERQQQNIALAQKVYGETSLKYREGLSTMSDLLQDEMNLSSAQAAYLNALYSFKNAEVQIMSLNGEIRNLINQ